MIPSKIFHNRFLPISLPEYIQMDITNRCNIKCIYCNVQGSYNYAKGDMDITIAEIFFKELRDIKWNKIIREYRPFMNGDSLMLSSDAFYEFLKLGRKYLPYSKNVLYSNGANSNKSSMFLTSLLDEVHFTVSASTPKTYEKIHGLPLFNEVIKTFNMIMDSKNHPEIYVHFIYNKYNENELYNWREIFNGAKLMVSPLHYTDEQQTSLDILDMKNMEIGYKIGTTANGNKLYFWHPCNCWNNLSISYKGEYLQCPDVHYKYNYGKVGEISIKNAWVKRVKDGLKCSGCNSCNLKNKNQEVLSYITEKWMDLF